MANLVAIATGNFTSSSTWGVCSSVTNAHLDNDVSTFAVGTSNLDSTTWTPGVETYIGVALKLAGRAASPSGTFTVTLRNSTDGTDAASVTVNVSDLPSAGLGWVFFKFGSSVTTVTAKAYLIRVVCSASGSQVTLYRGATSNDCSRKVVTNTTAAPASGDQLVICGERTAAATSAAYTVTNDNTATTSFGPTVSGGPPQGMVVSDRGTFTWGTSASTAYYFKLKGILFVCAGGTVNIGTSGTPIPSTSSNELVFDCVATNDSGLVVDSGGTFNHYGVTKTTWTTITADSAAAATSLTVGDTTGWEANDSVAIGTVDSNNGSSYETRTINTVPSGTSITLTSGMTYAQTNTAQYPPSIINQTHRCKIRGNTGGSLNAYIIVKGTGALTIKYAEIAFMGGGTTNKRGINLQQTSGSGVTIESCSFKDFSGNSYIGIADSTSYGANTTYKNCAGYNIASGIQFTSAAASTLTFEGNCFIRMAGDGIDLRVHPITTLKNNRFSHTTSGSAIAVRFMFPGSSAAFVMNGSANADAWSGNIMYSCNTAGVIIQNQDGLSFNNPWPQVSNLYLKNWKIWACNWPTAGGGINIQGVCLIDAVFDGCELFGTALSAIYVQSLPYTCVLNARMYSCKSGSSTTRTTNNQQYGLYLSDASQNIWYMEGCEFGSTGTGKSAHTVSDLGAVSNYNEGFYQIVGSNCKLDSSTQVWTVSSSQGVYQNSNYIRMNRLGQTDAHKAWYRYGIESSDTTIFNTASPSARLTPNNASNKFESSPFPVKADASGSVTVTVQVRKSAAGDGAAYTGNQPRLMVRRSSEAGITADTVVATYTSGTGSWNSLSGTVSSITNTCVLEFFVDCDGTAGWINIDDWSA